jgi:superfamily II DNA or RNA helicase
MHLRPYQIELVTEASAGFRTHKRQILCAPTGSGKTVMFSEIVRRASERGTQTLILTDRIELFKQTFKSLHARVNDIQIVNAQTDEINFRADAVVTVGMVETVKRRLLLGFSPKLIIIDECHKGNFTKIITTHYPDGLVLGVTATPVGKHLPKLYSNLIQTVDIPDLVAEGFLSPCQAFQMVDDFSDLSVQNGEYTETSQFSHFNKRVLYAGVVEQYQKRTPGRKCIVFNVNIEHAQKMTEEFRSAGIVSECITSKTPKAERERILSAFSAGLFPVLNNCGILTTGYDEPSIEVVIMNRKTKSLPLWLQCCGRGSRIYPNKTHFTVLDFGMNHDEHGLWSEPRAWSLTEKKKKKRTDIQASPVRTCPKCEAMLPARAPKCEYCGHEFPKPEAEIKEGVMIEVKSRTPDHLKGKRIEDMSPAELVELQKSKRFATKFIWRIARQQSDEFLKEYASLAGYSWGWRHKQKELRDGSETKFVVV